MKVIEPSKIDQPLLEVGDIIISRDKMYMLMREKESKFCFRSADGNGFNGVHDSLSSITEETRKSHTIIDGRSRLYRASEYELQLVLKK